jgi:hypothetical protein
MPLAKMRPTFEFPSPLDQEQTVAHLRTLIDEAHHPVDGRIAGTHLMLVIPPAARHFWSPWLQIEVHDENSGASVHGRFSPNPSIWTCYMLAYCSILVLVFFQAIFGFAQLMMNKSPWALLLIPIFLTIAAIMYWTSLIGQRLANDQMHELHDAVADKLKTQSSPD